MFLAKNPLLLTYLRFTTLLSRLRKKPAEKRERRHILIANLAHFGDVVLTTGVIHAVRATYPDAKIGFLGSSAAQVVLRTHPHVDHIHQFTHWNVERSGSLLGKWVRSLVTFFKALHEMRSIGYDLVMDVYPYYPNGALLHYLAGIPERIGYTSGGWGYFYTTPLTWSFYEKHVTEYHRDVLVAAGIRYTGSLAPSLPRQSRPVVNGEYIVVHMCAGAVQKEWGVEKWRALLTQFGCPLLLTGKGKREAAMARELGLGQSLVDTLSWDEFVAVVQHAKGILCVDSAIGHIASAFNTPTVTIFSGINTRSQWQPMHDKARVLTAAVSCVSCGKKGGCAAMDCVQGLTIREVKAAADAIF